MHQKWTQKIRTIENFPKEGISFKDITPALADPDFFFHCIEEFADIIFAKYLSPLQVMGIEARGFILGAALASRSQSGFITCRKQGKLPKVPTLIQQEYSLEYGTASLELDSSLIKKRHQIIIMDDVLATGGSLGAAIDLVKRCDIPVEKITCCALIELTYLKGREFIEEKYGNKIEIISLIKY